MIKFVSTKGDASPVNFEDAVLNGFADDGGMYVPEKIVKISLEQLQTWSSLSYNELALKILSLYVDTSIIPFDDLGELIRKSTVSFNHPDIIPVVPLDKKSRHYVMELFHGPTFSFKDVAMGFLINVMDYFLKRKKSRISLLIATTGDTGPAAAYASCGKKNIDCWVMYPKGLISEEQERQMTTLDEPNVHAVCVENCDNGCDDIDLVIAEMFRDREIVEKFNLSSVNSINWCRVMFQSVHYFYSYFQYAKNIGDKVVFSVPTGAFGNQFAGYLAREMGLPVEMFIAANNANGAIYRVHRDGKFQRESLKKTTSNAIDIAQPYNYWRFLYFACGQDGETIKKWTRQYENGEGVVFDEAMMTEIKRGFLAAEISDDETVETINKTYNDFGYLLDPHGAVAVAATNRLASEFDKDTAIISLLTAHPSKFPEVTRKAFDGEIPEAGKHHCIEEMKDHVQKITFCDCMKLKVALINGMHQVVLE